MDLTRFNDDQKKVILHDQGPAIAIASAGSGKTSCVTYRIATLIENGVNPENIWATTFTNKAAKEITERVVHIVGEAAEHINIGTLHSLCYRILKRFEKNVTIMNNLEQWMFFDRWMKDNKNSRVKDIKYVLQAISKLKLSLIRHGDYKEQIKNLIESQFTSIENSDELCLYYMYRDYEVMKKDQGKIDFADMLMRTYFHLKNPDNVTITKRIIDKIEYLIVDESQDANKASYEIYKILGSKKNNTMLVGDPRQAIYSFQGSSYNYMTQFVSEYNARVIELPLNYRSTQTIVNHSNQLIQCDAFFQNSNSVTINELGDLIDIMKSTSELEEARYISELIKAYLQKGYDYKDIAILYRVNAQSMPIVDAFTMQQIPFILHSKNTFYRRREVRQVVTYMKAFLSPGELTLDEMKLIANAPTRYIKSVVLTDFDDDASANGDSLFETMKNNVHDLRDYKQREAVTKLINTIKNGLMYVLNESPTTRELVNYVLQEVGFQKWLENDSSNDDIEADDDKYLNIEVLFSACDTRENPEEFVHYANNMAKRDPKNENENTNGVHLMTMHSSKGLEFPVVIIAGACSRLMPYFRASTEENYREERRVAYVGVTRAKKKLVMSAIEGKFGRFNVRPTMYIEDMGITHGRATL